MLGQRLVILRNLVPATRADSSRAACHRNEQHAPFRKIWIKVLLSVELGRVRETTTQRVTQQDRLRAARLRLSTAEPRVPQLFSVPFEERLRSELAAHPARKRCESGMSKLARGACAQVSAPASPGKLGTRWSSARRRTRCGTRKTLWSTYSAARASRARQQPPTPAHNWGSRDGAKLTGERRASVAELSTALLARVRPRVCPARRRICLPARRAACDTLPVPSLHGTDPRRAAKAVPSILPRGADAGRSHKHTDPARRSSRCTRHSVHALCSDCAHACAGLDGLGGLEPLFCTVVRSLAWNRGTRAFFSCRREFYAVNAFGIAASPK